MRLTGASPAGDEEQILQRPLAPALVAPEEIDQGRRVLFPPRSSSAGRGRRSRRAASGRPRPGHGSAWPQALAGERRDLAMCLKGATRITALWPQYGPQSACHQALPSVQERIPRRMPNWKMRAKALVVGMPTTRLCRMPSLGSICMMPHHAQDRRGSHEAVGVERHHQVVTVAPALKEIADVAGLEAGVGLAPAVGDGEAARPFRRRSPNALLCRRNIRPAGVAQHIDVEAPPCPALESSIMVARLRTTRWGASLRTHVRIAVEASRWTAPPSGRLRDQDLARIAREAHDDEPDGGVPKTDGQPRRRQGEQHQQQEIDCTKPPAESVEDGENQQRGERCRHQRPEHETAAENTTVGQKACWLLESAHDSVAHAAAIKSP